MSTEDTSKKGKEEKKEKKEKRDPWTSGWRQLTPDSDTSDDEQDNAPPRKATFTSLSRDAQLARDLDLNSRYDAVIFKETPFTHAKKRAEQRARNGEANGSSEGKEKFHGSIPVPDPGAFRKRQHSPSPQPRKPLGTKTAPMKKRTTVTEATKKPVKSAPADVPEAPAILKRPPPSLSPPPFKKTTKRNLTDWVDAFGNYAPAASTTKRSSTSQTRTLLDKIDGIEAPPPKKAKKSKKKGNAKQDDVNVDKGKKRARKTSEEIDRVIFGRIREASRLESRSFTDIYPAAGAGPSSDFPICQAIERQKTLPLKMPQISNNRHTSQGSDSTSSGGAQCLEDLFKGIDKQASKVEAKKPTQNAHTDGQDAIPSLSRSGPTARQTLSRPLTDQNPMATHPQLLTSPLTLSKSLI